MSLILNHHQSQNVTVSMRRWLQIRKFVYEPCKPVWTVNRISSFRMYMLSMEVFHKYKSLHRIGLLVYRQLCSSRRSGGKYFKYFECVQWIQSIINILSSVSSDAQTAPSLACSSLSSLLSHRTMTSNATALTSHFDALFWIRVSQVSNWNPHSTLQFITSVSPFKRLTFAARNVRSFT